MSLVEGLPIAPVSCTIAGEPSWRHSKYRESFRLTDLNSVGWLIVSFLNSWGPSISMGSKPSAGWRSGLVDDMSFAETLEPVFCAMSLLRSVDADALLVSCDGGARAMSLDLVTLGSMFCTRWDEFAIGTGYVSPMLSEKDCTRAKQKVDQSLTIGLSVRAFFTRLIADHNAEYHSLIILHEALPKMATLAPCGVPNDQWQNGASDPSAVSSQPSAEGGSNEIMNGGGLPQFVSWADSKLWARAGASLNQTTGPAAQSRDCLAYRPWRQPATYPWLILTWGCSSYPREPPWIHETQIADDVERLIESCSILILIIHSRGGSIEFDKYASIWVFF